MKYLRLILALACIAGAIHVATSAATSDPPTTSLATVSGHVNVPAQTPQPETIVYLGPGENQFISPPDEIVKVSQKGAKFAPSLTMICVGQSVDFLNDEDRPIDHNVFSNSPTTQFDLGVYKPGDHKIVKFDKPGPVFLFCSIHRFMDGVVFVAPSPFFSRVDASGRFQIQNVPPGKWTLCTWQSVRRFPDVRIELNLANGQTLTQDLPLKRK